MMGLLLHIHPRLSDTAHSSPNSSQTSLTSPRTSLLEDVGHRKIDDQKICQWYCCQCGQSYGSITYTGEDRHHDLEDSATKSDSASADDSREHHDESNPLQALRYYSQFVYDNPVTGAYSYAASHIRGFLDGDSTSEECEETDGSQSSQPPQVSRQNLTNDVTSSNYLIQLDPENRRQQVYISVPSRFNCHRCNHMMCPYCLKIRVKDLKHK